MSKEIKIKGGMIPVTTLILESVDINTLKSELPNRISDARALFTGMPVIIDVGQIDIQPDKFASIVDTLRDLKVNPIGAKGLNHIERTCELKGISYFGSGLKASDEKSKETKEVEQPEGSKKTEETAKKEMDIDHKRNAKTLVVRNHVRSGQQVYCEEGDLIIIGNVNTGAEILAAGNIHVYGTLRGRAMAGVAGNDDAQIFANSMCPELLSINGDYTTQEDIPQSVFGSYSRAHKKDELICIDGI